MSISPELKKMMRALEAAFGSGMPIDYQVGIDRDGGGAELWEIDPEASYPSRPTFRVEGYGNEEEAFLALAAQIEPSEDCARLRTELAARLSLPWNCRHSRPS